jgi:hypothetical protein
LKEKVSNYKKKNKDLDRRLAEESVKYEQELNNELNKSMNLL